LKKSTKTGREKEPALPLAARRAFWHASIEAFHVHLASSLYWQDIRRGTPAIILDIWRQRPILGLNHSLGAFEIRPEAVFAGPNVLLGHVCRGAASLNYFAVPRTGLPAPSFAIVSCVAFWAAFIALAHAFA
jgi:hypothetical protein